MNSFTHPFRPPTDLIRGPVSDVLPLSGEANWGIDLFGVDALRDITNGEGVIAGIVDTGIDRSHPLLSNCVNSRDFTASGSGPNDRNGHGTHVSGTVGATDPNIGVAPGCKLVHGKGLSDSGSGAGTWIAQAIMWCAAEGAEVISMSLGSPSEDPSITAAMREVAAKGVWVVCAAGNSGANTPDVDWPGRSPYCISVAALNQQKEPASFSSAGNKIDCAFSGVNIWSCAPGGGFQQMSGTSMATPGTAGVLVLYRAALRKLSLPIPGIEQLRLKLAKLSVDTYTPGDDRRTGPGWASPVMLFTDLTAPPPKAG